jgi:hypothetical protein
LAPDVLGFAGRCEAVCITPPQWCRGTATVTPRLTAFLSADAACAAFSHHRERGVTELDYELKLDELDRLLNDPEVAMEPARIWSLLAEIKDYNSGNTDRGAG